MFCLKVTVLIYGNYKVFSYFKVVDYLDYRVCAYLFLNQVEFEFNLGILFWFLDVYSYY